MEPLPEDVLKEMTPEERRLGYFLKREEKPKADDPLALLRQADELVGGQDPEQEDQFPIPEAGDIVKGLETEKDTVLTRVVRGGLNAYSGAGFGMWGQKNPKLGDILVGGEAIKRQKQFGEESDDDPSVQLARMQSDPEIGIMSQEWEKGDTLDKRLLKLYEAGVKGRRSWEEMEPQFAAMGGDVEKLKGMFDQDTKMRDARQWARKDPDAQQGTFEFVRKNMLPFYSAGKQFNDTREYKNALDRVAKGEGSDDDRRAVARYEYQQELDQGPRSALNQVAAAPGFMAELLLARGGTVVAGKLAGALLNLGAKTAGATGKVGRVASFAANNKLTRAGMGSATKARPSLGGQSAAELAGVTALSPGGYAPQVAQKHYLEGQSWEKAVASSYVYAYAQNAVIGQMIGRNTAAARWAGAAPGGKVGRLAAQTSIGLAEQQGLDAGSSTIDRLAKATFGYTLGLDTKYGSLGEIGRQESDWGWRVGGQIASFATFVALGHAQHKLTGQSGIAQQQKLLQNLKKPKVTPADSQTARDIAKATADAVIELRDSYGPDSAHVGEMRVKQVLDSGEAEYSGKRYNVGERARWDDKQQKLHGTLDKYAKESHGDEPTVKLGDKTFHLEALKGEFRAGDEQRVPFAFLANAGEGWGRKLAERWRQAPEAVVDEASRKRNEDRVVANGVVQQFRDMASRAAAAKEMAVDIVDGKVDAQKLAFIDAELGTAGLKLDFENAQAVRGNDKTIWVPVAKLGLPPEVPAPPAMRPWQAEVTGLRTQAELASLLNGKTDAEKSAIFMELKQAIVAGGPESQLLKTLYMRHFAEGQTGESGAKWRPMSIEERAKYDAAVDMALDKPFSPLSPEQRALYKKEFDFIGEMIPGDLAAEIVFALHGDWEVMQAHIRRIKEESGSPLPAGRIAGTYVRKDKMVVVNGGDEKHQISSLGIKAHEIGHAIYAALRARDPKFDQRWGHAVQKSDINLISKNVEKTKNRMDEVRRSEAFADLCRYMFAERTNPAEMPAGLKPVVDFLVDVGLWHPGAQGKYRQLDAIHNGDPFYGKDVIVDFSVHESKPASGKPEPVAPDAPPPGDKPADPNAKPGEVKPDKPPEKPVSDDPAADSDKLLQFLAGGKRHRDEIRREFGPMDLVLMKLAIAKKIRQLPGGYFEIVPDPNSPARRAIWEQTVNAMFESGKTFKDVKEHYKNNGKEYSAKEIETILEYAKAKWESMGKKKRTFKKEASKPAANNDDPQTVKLLQFLAGGKKHRDEIIREFGPMPMQLMKLAISKRIKELPGGFYELIGEAPPAPPPSGNAKPEPQKPITDLPIADFSKEVQAVADAFPFGHYDNKVFIADIYDYFKKQNPKLSEAAFKSKLIEAIQDGKMELASLDMVDYADPDVVERSKTMHPLSQVPFHMIVTPSNPKRQARAKGSPPADNANKAAMPYLKDKPQVLIGKEAYVTDADGSKYQVYYVAMPRRMANASHLLADDGSRFRGNPAYEGVNPREYDLKVSKEGQVNDEKVRNVARNYDVAKRYGDSPEAQIGMPTLTERSLSAPNGNGRLMAEQMMQHLGNGYILQKAAVDNAAKFGLDPEAVAKIPDVGIYRVIPDSVLRWDDPRMTAFAQAGNANEAAAQTPLRAAKSLADRLRLDFSEFVGEVKGTAVLSDVISGPAGSKMRKAFHDGLPANERVQYFIPGGYELTVLGKKTLAQLAMMDVGFTVDVLEKMGEEFAKTSNNLEAALPQLLKLKKDKKIDLISPMNRAIEAWFRSAKLIELPTVTALNEELGQGTLDNVPSLDIDPAAAMMLEFLIRNQNNRQALKTGLAKIADDNAFLNADRNLFASETFEGDKQAELKAMSLLERVAKSLEVQQRSGADFGGEKPSIRKPPAKKKTFVKGDPDPEFQKLLKASDAAADAADKAAASLQAAVDGGAGKKVLAKLQEKKDAADAARAEAKQNAEMGLLQLAQERGVAGEGLVKNLMGLITTADPAKAAIAEAIVRLKMEGMTYAEIGKHPDYMAAKRADKQSRGVLKKQFYLEDTPRKEAEVIENSLSAFTGRPEFAKNLLERLKALASGRRDLTVAKENRDEMRDAAMDGGKGMTKRSIGEDNVREAKEDQADIDKANEFFKQMGVDPENPLDFMEVDTDGLGLSADQEKLVGGMKNAPKEDRSWAKTIRESAAAISGFFTRAYKEIPISPRFRQAAEYFRLGGVVPEAAVDEASRMILEPIQNLSKEDAGKFQLLLAIRNYDDEINPPPPMTKNAQPQIPGPLRYRLATDHLTAQQHRTMVSDLRTKLESWAASKPDVTNALIVRESNRTRIVSEALAAGVKLSAEAMANSNYYHQYIAKIVERQGEHVEVQGGKNVSVFSRKAREKDPATGKLLDHLDPSLDPRMDYVEAEMRWMAELIKHTRQRKLYKEFITKPYDLTQDPTIRKELEDVVFTDNGLDIHEYVRREHPDYLAYQPQPGDNVFEAFTVGDNVVHNLLMGGTQAITADNLRRVMALGHEKSWQILPKEIVRQLETQRIQDKPNLVGRILRKAQGFRKFTMLHNPASLVHYTLSNATGNGEMLVFAPGMIKEIGHAHYDVLAHLRGDRLSNYGPLSAAHARDLGVFGGGQLEKEYARTSSDKMFKKFYPKKGLSRLKQETYDRYKDAAINVNRYVDDVARVAAYRYYLKKLQNNDLTHYGASDPVAIHRIAQMHGKDRAAARLANDLFGNYRELSQFGDYMRKNVSWFWGWTENVLKRYPQLFMNTVRESIGATGAYSRKGSWVPNWKRAKPMRTAAIAVMGAMLYGAAQMWNRTVMKDEDDDLPPEIRNRFHLTLRRREDGYIQVLDNVSALMDFSGWLGMDTIAQEIPKHRAGQTTTADTGEKVAKGIGKKLYNSVGPLKNLVEAGFGRTLSYGVEESRPVRRDESVAEAFGVKEIYRVTKGMPVRKGWGERFLGAKAVGPGQSAQMEVTELIKDWKDQKNIKHTSPPVEAKIKDMRDAANNDDYEAFVLAKRKYVAEIGSEKKAKERFAETLAAMNAFAAGQLNKQQQDEFQKWLTPEQKRKLETAKSHTANTKAKLAKWWQQAK